MTSRLDRLSERESEILRLFVRGHDAKSAAADLGLSVHTVNERLREARRKLGVSSSREAARLLLAHEGAGALPEKLGPEKIGVAGAGGIEADRARPAPRAAGLRRRLILAGGATMIIALVAAAAALSSSHGEGYPSPRTPIERLIGADDYPAASAGTGGKVGYRLAVDSDGRVTACLVTRSSGDRSLDTATCRLILSRARFAPARDREGRPHPADYEGALDWPR